MFYLSNYNVSGSDEGAKRNCTASVYDFMIMITTKRNDLIGRAVLVLLSYPHPHPRPHRHRHRHPHPHPHPHPRYEIRHEIRTNEKVLRQKLAYNMLSLLLIFASQTFVSMKGYF